MELRLHGTERMVTALGPGRRFTLWVQGCRRRCPGCISPDTWDPAGGYAADVEALAERIAVSGCDGLTISGGEPFLQAEALCALLDRIRALHGPEGVILYTGNTLEQLQADSDPWVQGLLSRCDLLIDGVYDETKNDGKNLRGSSNQRTIPLTDLYRREAAAYGTQPAQVEFFFHEDRVRMVGIPSKDMLERMKKTWCSQKGEE